MGERTVPLKPDEQYPLLKIEGGGGDINHAAPAQTVVTPAWGVTCTKTSRFSRWPEFLSACWMTLILCGISYLVFHTLAIGLYRRQPANYNCLERDFDYSKPASKVFFHHIVPRKSQIPLLLYSEYLANMATQYPLLHYNVYFLVDDLYPDALRGQKRNNSWLHNHKLDDIATKPVTELLKRYKINLTIMSLSKYMDMTPLKFKWRLVPRAHLIFYARVFSVWKNGGIGIDLRMLNNDGHNHLTTNPRIDAILRQHNDGINAEDYTKALNKIDNDEANTVINMFAGIINNILNETRSFFNRTLLFPPISIEKSPLIRTHRSKRETKNDSENTVLSVPSNDSKNFYNVYNDSLYLPTNLSKTKNESTEVIKNKTTNTLLNMTSENATDVKNRNVNGNNTETHQVVLFYDFSVLTGHTGPLSNSFSAHKPESASKTASHQFLSIDAEGMFIAASSRCHPFLARLVSAGYFAMPPKLAIRDVFTSQCGEKWGSAGIDVFKEDAYCNNIYIL